MKARDGHGTAMRMIIAGRPYGRLLKISNFRPRVNIDYVVQEFRGAVDNELSLILETVTPEHAAYELDGWPEFLGKVPPSSLLAPLRAVAAAHAARHWQDEGVFLVGVRAWTVAGGSLWPFFFDSKCWTRPIATARCGLRHRAPAWDCECGLYAARPECPQSVPNDGDEYAVGLVELFGRVIPYEAGWRAERARILEVWVPEGSAIDYDRYPGVTWHTL